jgi:hypothetical protein
VVFVIPAGLYTLLRSDTVQNYLANKAATFLSKELNTKVKVGGVSFGFLLKIVLKDVYIEDKHNSVLLRSDNIGLSFSNIIFSERKIIFNKVSLDNAYFNLVKYKNEEDLNLQFIIDYFSSDDTTTSKEVSKPWKLMLYSLKISDTRFRYCNQDVVSHDFGMNYGEIDISKINLDIRDISIKGDTIDGDIRYLSAEDKGGFKLYFFSAQARVSSHEITTKNLKIITPNSNLKLDLSFTYNEYNDINDFVDKVNITSDIRQSKFNLIDVSYFAHELEGMDDKVYLTANVRGKINNLKVKKLKFLYQKSTYFDGDVSMSGLPNLEETFVNISLKNLTSTKQEIESIKIPGVKLNLGNEFAKLGYVNVKGFFTGFYNDFVAKATIKTSLGKIITDLSLKNNKTEKSISYNGKISTESFDLGSFIDNSKLLGIVTMDGNISGKGMSAETADFEITGNIKQFGFNKYNYSDITVNGSYRDKAFNGDIDVHDPNIDLCFKGYVSIKDTLPDFDFTATIKHADIYKLNFVKTDTFTDISTKLKIDFTGTTIDNLQGYVIIDSSSYYEAGERYDIKSIKLLTTISKTHYRVFDLTSDFLDAKFMGYFAFNEMESSINKFISTYLPGISVDKSKLDSINSKQKFDFDIEFNNSYPLFKHFVTDIKLSGDARFWGSYNAEVNSLNFNGLAKEIVFSGVKVHNFSLEAVTESKHILLNAKTDGANLSDSVGLYNITLNSSINNDSVDYQLNWDNKLNKKKYAGDVMGFLKIGKNLDMLVGFKKSELVFNDTIWKINPDSKVNIDTTGTTFNNFLVSSFRQKILLDGKISKIPQDKLKIRFEKFNISNFDIITNINGVDFDGYIDGDFEAANIYNNPTFISDLRIQDFGFNSDRLGDLLIRSNWDDNSKGIAIDAEVQKTGSVGIGIPLKIKGHYFPVSKTNNFDLTASFSNFDMKSLSRYLEGIGAIKEGRANGSIKLTGLNTSPELFGKVHLNRMLVKIDYLNTNVSFADTVYITKNLIYFNKIKVLDQQLFNQSERIRTGKNDTLVASGRITHNYFKDFKYSIDLFPKDFLCLNTNPSVNNLFYGTAYASGYANISGNSDMVYMDITARTMKGTQLIIPLNASSDLSESDFITFINIAKPDSTKKIKTRDLSGIQMDFTFDVTDDAEVQLVFDPRYGDKIKAKGSGIIKMEITTKGDFNMYGEYTVKQGDYLFTFQNVINKKFNVLSGGTIRWNGSPYNADLDLQAIYSLKASLSGLGLDTNRNNVPVECIINITGKLEKPSYNFEIRLPSLTEFEKSQYMTVINQNIDYEFLSLLVINSFVPASDAKTNVGVTNGNMVGKTISEALSAQLSNWISQISKKVDIGFKYTPSDNISKEQVEVALSTQLFNDRVKIESNLGVGGGQVSTQTQNSQNIIGDLNVEVKITDELKLKVFNKSNQYDALNSYSPYTQGIGIFYRREFNTLKDLFMRKKNIIK